jgi:glutamate formiminotransferase / 5-formyltetrahydrofolate cyclo-ligase
MVDSILLGVPNVSEGRDAAAIDAIAAAFEGAPARNGTRASGEHPSAGAARGARLLDLHSDPDHHRSVFTLAAAPGELADALLAGAAAAVQRIDVMAHSSQDRAGQHPHVGALDVAPVVYLDAGARGAACAEALVLADRIGEQLEVPVFLYGELTASGGGSGRTRAELRRGGVAGLAKRMRGGGHTHGGEQAQGGLRPDFGPPRMHPTAGATLVAARAPLVAFNLLLEPPATLADARRIAALIREGGEQGLPGVRAIGVAVNGGAGQVSMNVERPLDVPLAVVLQAVRRLGAVAGAELVGLAPRAALEGFPPDVELHGFDPARHVIENALGF